MKYAILAFLFVSNSSWGQDGTLTQIHTGPGDNVGRDKIVNYTTIQKIIRTPEDKQLLFLGLSVTEATADHGQSQELLKKCRALHALCVNSLISNDAYSMNKKGITDLLAEIFKLQGNPYKESIAQQSKQDYDYIQWKVYLDNIRKLRISTDENDLQETIDLLIRQISGINQLDEANADTLVKNHLALLLKGTCFRMQHSDDIAEIDKLFSLHALLLGGGFSRMEDEMIYATNEAILFNFEESKKMLGNFLLEGYKKYLQQNKHLKKKPTLADTKAIYEFILISSDNQTLKRNVLMAQIYLFEHGVLQCPSEKVTKGWGWSSNEKLMQTIPTVTMIKSLQELQAISEIGDSTLNYSHFNFDQRQREIKTFHYKLDHFLALPRDTRYTETDYDGKHKSLLFQNELFYGYKTYSKCNLFEYVYDDLHPVD